jgi:hypothetical protein
MTDVLEVYEEETVVGDVEQGGENEVDAINDQLALVTATSVPTPLQSVDLDSLSLTDLEELSYGFAQIAGEYEVSVWFILAYIRDSGLWRKDDPESTWEDYARAWLHEACSRSGRQMSYSLRAIQTKLSVHRRLVRSIGADPNLIMGASTDAMAKFTRALGTWNPETGELMELTSAAALGLESLYPDEPDVMGRVRRAANDIAQIPVHKEALRFIEDNLTGGNSTRVVIKFQVVVGVSGAPYTLAEVVTFKDGVPSEQRVYGPNNIWPDFVVHDLKKRLGSP